MVVQHNISAMTANRYYGVNNKSLAGSLEKLASGYAINKAGDNAAGLAVSEKMRAQIGGLTQASKNAEDGISMVQTFEGALQETDSILQRMRTLAVQSANGSYQDDVDRDAIQLEFDQLNDELNQIADTDYNGTVMLNGGTMADGVHAVDGKIDYSNKKSQVFEATKSALQAKVDATQQNYNKAVKDYASGKYDLSSNGEAPEWNTVDNKAYNQNAADALWGAAGYTTTGTNKYADTTQADTIEITFESDGNGGWSVSKATSYLNGEKVDDLTTRFKSGGDGELTVTPDATPATATGKGGFAVTTKSGKIGGVKQRGTTTDVTAAVAESLGNAVFDNTQVSKGSTVTLKYTNGAATKMAPNNIGINESTQVVSEELKTSSDTQPTASAALEDRVIDSNMDADMESALKAIENAKIEWSYDNVAGFAAGNVTVNGKELAIDNAVKIADNEGNAAWAKMAADGTVTFYDNAAAADTDKIVTVTNSADDTLDNATSDMTGTGKFSVEISMSQHKYSDATSAKLTVSDDPDLESSGKPYQAMQTAQKAFENAAKDLSELRSLNKDVAQDWEKIKEFYSSSQSSSGAAVSVSDNFDNGRAKLTYTDTMSLQVGARSKDLVDFTFKYSTDLGGLQQNLNCSSREGGLETAKLSLQTAESANAAIDKIDNAINKVNMVRATFGAVQNRLEHKINNIDTNTENLTAAESRIRDTQMDKEMMKFTSSQILSQASQSMLAQANQLPQGVLQLLG